MCANVVHAIAHTAYVRPINFPEPVVRRADGVICPIGFELLDEKAGVICQVASASEQELNLMLRDLLAEHPEIHFDPTWDDLEIELRGS